MTDLLSRANVDIAINTLLDDLQPNDAIQPSDHNGLLKDILDTLSNGLSTTLRTNPETSGQDIEITSGDKIKFKNSGFVSSLLTDTLTATRTLTFPDNSGTIALLSDITGGNTIYSANDSLTGNREVNLNAFNLDFINGANSLFKITTSGNISKGSDNAEATSGFKHTDINDDVIFDIRNNGQMGYGGAYLNTVGHKFRNPNSEAIIASFDNGMSGVESFKINTNGSFESEQSGQRIFWSYRQSGQSYIKLFDAGVESVRFNKLTSFINSDLLVGGTSTENDIKILKDDTPHIIVGCPGRIHDMLRRKHINLDTIKFVVLDEADEMLSSGFKEQIYNIFQYLAKDIQIALFSATMPSSLYQLTEKFMRNPIKIIVKAEQLTLEGIKQYFVNLEDDNMKYDTLKDLFSTFSVAQCIIYCNSVRRVSDLYDAMNQDDYPVCQIHSGLDKVERQKNYDQFRSGNYRVLISSNVTARGIDIQQVSTVINFDIPKCSSTYLHRIGRSGRWGRKGVAINFITRRDYKHLKEIESFYQTQINELPNDYKGS